MQAMVEEGGGWGWDVGVVEGGMNGGWWESACVTAPLDPPTSALLPAFFMNDLRKMEHEGLRLRNQINREEEVTVLSLHLQKDERLQTVESLWGRNILLQNVIYFELNLFLCLNLLKKFSHLFYIFLNFLEYCNFFDHCIFHNPR